MIDYSEEYNKLNDIYNSENIYLIFRLEFRRKISTITQRE